MKKKMGAVAAVAVASLLSAGEAVAQKGGGSVRKVGDNTAGLMADIIGPILIVLVGAIAVTAMVKREVGMAISATVVGILAGSFVFAPDQMEGAFTSIYQAVF